MAVLLQEHLYPILLKILQRTMKPLMRDHTLVKCVSKQVHDQLTEQYGVFVYSHFDKVQVERSMGLSLARGS